MWERVLMWAGDSYASFYGPFDAMRCVQAPASCTAEAVVTGSIALRPSANPSEGNKVSRIAIVVNISSSFSLSGRSMVLMRGAFDARGAIFEFREFIGDQLSTAALSPKNVFFCSYIYSQRCCCTCGKICRCNRTEIMSWRW